MKHTKGPWHILIEGEEEDFITRTIVNANPQRNLSEIALITTGSFDDETESANAHLIAAAPELLEALEELVKLGKRPIGENDSKNYEAYQKGRIAIAKAKNESL